MEDGGEHDRRDRARSEVRPCAAGRRERGCGSSGGDAGRPFEKIPVGAPASATLGNAGGTLTSTDGRLTLTFPAGALAADTTITIQELEWDGGHAWELGPEGLALAMPVGAVVTLAESEIGAPSRTMESGVEVLELPVPFFDHVWQGGREDLTVKVDWREAEAALDYSFTLQHFSVVYYVQTPRGRFKGEGSANVGQQFAVGVSVTDRDYAPVNLIFECGREEKVISVRARWVPTYMEISLYELIAWEGMMELPPPDLGRQVVATCAHPGADAFEQSTGWYWQLEEYPDCRLAERSMGTIREILFMCVGQESSCFTDPVDLGLDPNGDPSLDIVCAKSGVNIDDRPWVEAVFEGPWFPSPSFYSWCSKVTLYGANGVLGSYTIEHHDGMDSFLVTGMLTMTNTAYTTRPSGYDLIFPASLKDMVVSATVESGIKKTVDAPFLSDSREVNPFEKTLNGPL
jgi:hypothetical protein